MIQEATMDACDAAEQVGGWFTVLVDELELPFEAKVLGVVVSVTAIDLRDRGEIVAICTRGRERQAIGLMDLRLPSPRPAGADWIDAYRCWLGGR